VRQISRLFKRATALAFAMFMLAALAVSAAAPNVRSVTAANTPVVDGVESDWQTSPTDATNPDWFTFICTPAHNSCATPTADLFMRYNCTTNTLYVLVLTRAGNTYTVDAVNNFVSTGVSGNLLQDAPPFTTNASPNMWRDLIDGKGFEAAANKFGPNNSGPAITPGTYNNIDFIAEINGIRSGTEDRQLILSCTPTAVTVSSISAEVVDSRGNWTSWALGAAGLVVLGGLMVVAFRRR
jgi:hypothetical protein